MGKDAELYAPLHNNYFFTYCASGNNDGGGGGRGDGDRYVPMDLIDEQVGKYTFFEHLAHYLDRNCINASNLKAVKLAIFAETGIYIQEASTCILFVILID